jgi:hypothetical protein
MKLSVRALFQTSSINCEKVTEGEDVVETLTARAAIISESSVASVDALAERDQNMRPTDKDPDVQFGDILVVTRQTDGSTVAEILKPGTPSSFYVKVGDEDLNLSASFLKLRESIVAYTSNDNTLTDSQRSLLMGVQETLEMAASLPDPERFNSKMLADAFQASMIDSFGDFEMGVTPEDFVKKSRADLIRARIAMINPDHPDALVSSNTLGQTLENMGVTVNINGLGAQVRAPGNQQITEDAMRRTIQANDKLCRDVFGALTETPIEKLNASMISIRDLETIRDGFADKRLTGDWVDTANKRAHELTRGAMGNYSFEMDVFVSDGRDIMVINDTVGQSQGVAFVYSWPTATRRAVMEIESGLVANVSPEEIPTDEEIERLQAVMQNLLVEADLVMDRELLERPAMQ